jgi:hypothetical protein
MRRGPKRRTVIGGQFAPRLIEMLESPAWQVLTQSARRVIDRVEIEFRHHGGTQNGKLPVTYDDFVAYKIDRHSIGPAISEAESLGFLQVTERGRGGNAEFRRPNLFRLTFHHSDRNEPTHEWRRITTLELALQVKAEAREAANLREQRKAAKKQKSGGGKFPPPVGEPRTENRTSPVGVTPTTAMVGNPPLLSISRGGAHNQQQQRAGHSPTASAPATLIDGASLADPGSRQVSLLERWGASPEHARNLMKLLAAVAGPHRLAHLDELYAKMESRRWDGRRRIEWLRQQAESMAGNPLYWPEARVPRSATGSTAIINVLRAAGKNGVTKPALIRAIGKTPAAVASLTQSMVNDGLIVRLRPGVFGLPTAENPQRSYVPARESVLRALRAAPGNMATTAELIVATGRPRSAVDAAVFRLIETREVVRVRRGVFALAYDAERARSRGGAS